MHSIHVKVELCNIDVTCFSTLRTDQIGLVHSKIGIGNQPKLSFSISHRVFFPCSVVFLGLRY